MVLRSISSGLVLLLLVTPQSVRAQTAPKLLSMFPHGGMRGTALEVEIRGTALEGTHAVWLGKGSELEPTKPHSAQDKLPHIISADGVNAKVKMIQNGSSVKVRLAIAPDARVGFHSLSLISPGGLSDAIPFWVGPDAVIQEATTSHRTPETAQLVKLPVAINGRLSESGQLAYYAFEVAQTQTMAFEIISLQGTGFDPQLALYEAQGSLLDPRRSKRLVFHEEITQGGMPAKRGMSYTFTKPGRYRVSLGNPFAQGGGDFSYLLRIGPVAPLAGSEDALAWGRRRLRELQSRAVGAQVADVRLIPAADSADELTQAKAADLPVVLERTIARPGDVHFIRFNGKAGQKLACEVQYPRAAPPHFNLRLDVLNAKGAVVLTNVSVKDGKLGTVDAKVIQLAPDLRGTLDKEGEYALRIRDVTSTHGSPDHVYRVLIRQQIPHLSDFQIQPNGPVNLRPGARQRLALSAQGKEGFAGTHALSVEGLPQGVQAFVGGSTIDLVADAKAPGTLLPQILRVSALAIVGGNSSFPFPVAEIPVMITRK